MDLMQGDHVVYFITKLENPDELYVFWLCLLGSQDHRNMRSPEEVTRRVPYYFHLREWFALGITEISMLQMDGRMRLTVTKQHGKEWEELLPLMMPPADMWQRWEDRSLRQLQLDEEWAQ